MNRYLVAITVMLPTLIEILDTSVVNVSLDHIRGSLSSTIDEATWAITAYLVSNAIVIPITGWLSRLFGRKTYLMLSIFFFTASSLLCGSAWSIRSLVIFRIIQGLAGGGLQPLSQAILLETFPPQQHGMAMAIFGVGIMFGPIIGPLLGGWITDNWSWRWIFYINIPIGALSLLLTALVIKDPPYMKRQRMKIDYIGLALLSLGIGSLQFVLDKGQREDWFASSTIVTFSILAILGIGLYIIWSLVFTDRPVVDLRIFKDRTYSTGNFLMFMAFFNLFGSIVLLPMLVQTMMGYTSFLAGLVLGPGGVATMMALPIAGRLVHRTNPKIVLIGGIAICAWSSYLMAQFNLQTHFWGFVWPRVILGIGMAFLFIPLTTMTVSHIPKERMQDATAMYNLLRNIGGSVGIAFITTVLSRRAQFHQFRLVEHLTPFDSAYQFVKAKLDFFLQGQIPSDAFIYRELLRQSGMLAYNDAFWLLSVLLFVILPLVFLMRRPKEIQTGPMH